jgi:hypothetical protein
MALFSKPKRKFWSTRSGKGMPIVKRRHRSASLILVLTGTFAVASSAPLWARKQAAAKGSPAAQAPASYQKLLTIADVEGVTGVKGLKLVPGEGDLNFAKADGSLLLMVQFGPRNLYDNWKARNGIVNSAVNGIGDEAFKGPSGSAPFILFFRKGDHSVSLHSYLNTDDMEPFVSQDQLRSLAKIILSRLYNQSVAPQPAASPRPSADQSRTADSVQTLIKAVIAQGSETTIKPATAALYGFGQRPMPVKKITILHRSLFATSLDNYSSLLMFDSFISGTEANPSAQHVYFIRISGSGKVLSALHSVDNKIVSDSELERDAQIGIETAHWLEEVAGMNGGKQVSPAQPAPIAPANGPTPSVLATISKMPEMVVWQDPAERAFTVNVPKGWKLSGGTHRNSKMDARNYVDAQSPDGKIRVWMNDPDVLPRQEPHPMYYKLGWYEGRTVKGPAGPIAIERFRTGEQFAQEFTKQKLCPNLQPLSAFDLRNESQQMNASIARAAASAHVQVQASAGEMVYRCGDRSGYTYSVTILAYTTPQGPHTWSVEKLAGYLSDKPDVDLARYVMNAMISSVKVDPNWQARYERDIQDTTGALMQISNQVTQQSMQLAQQSLRQNMRQVQQRQRQIDQISQMREDSFKKQMNSQDSIRQRWSDITLGQIHGCDDNGKCSTQPNDFQNHWVAPDGSVVGGPSDGSPPGPSYFPAQK